MYFGDDMGRMMTILMVLAIIGFMALAAALPLGIAALIQHLRFSWI